MVKNGARLASMPSSSTSEIAALHNETLTPQRNGSTGCRALVPLETSAPADALGPRGHGRPDAAFLTQLIACERRLPAYRERRRAEPADASARYGAGSGRDARPLLSRLF
ncbi:MAG: hypothetical protein ACFE0R_14565 [Salinarimonas sp.]